MLNRIKKDETFEPAEHRRQRVDLIRRLTFEVVPLSTIDDALAALPPGSEVSVTCSPVKGIATTMELTDRIRQLGHTAIPHISARMVESRDHTRAIADWMRTEEIGRLFLVGGDADPPAAYSAAVDFLRDLLDAEPGLHTIGVTAYPDGHAVIDDRALTEALHHKQAVLTEAGINGYASTQMCFDHRRISRWLEAERASGFVMPIHLGLPGVVDRAKLMTMGARLGIGASLSYLKKNRKAVAKLMAQPNYDPNDLLVPLSADLARLDVQGIHCFTFNQVAATDEWRQANLD